MGLSLILREVESYGKESPSAINLVLHCSRKMWYEILVPSEQLP